MENNIFKFAPNELVQDAFICWLLNEKKDEKIKEVAHKILRHILKDAKNKIKEDVNNIKFNDNDIEIYPQKSVKTNNYKIYNDNFQKKGPRSINKTINRKIDILVIIKRKYIIIIEDKVNTSEHGFQLLQYKQALEKEYKDHIILTCYYKTFDECNLENKKSYIDSIISRKQILSYLNSIETDNLYFNDYKKYLTMIDEIANPNNVLNKNATYFLREDKILDIRYLGLLKAIGEEDWGKSTEGNKYTWWCNYNLNMKAKSENNIFNDNFFSKVNFYEKEKMRISLRIGKKWLNLEKAIKEGIKKENTNIDYFFNGNEIIAQYCDISKKFNQDKIYEELKEQKILKYCKNFEKINKENELKNYEDLFIPRGYKGKDQKYELTIFTIQTNLDIDSKGVLEKTKMFMETFKEVLNEEINLEIEIKHK